MRIGLISLTILSACTFNVQPVISAPVTGSTALAFDTLRADLELHVPAATALESDAGDASYDVRDLDGSVHLTTEGGDVTAIGASRTDVTSSFGAIVIRGGSAVVTSEGGHVQLDVDAISVVAS